jgi:hypothetical protein
MRSVEPNQGIPGGRPNRRPGIRTRTTELDARDLVLVYLGGVLNGVANSPPGTRRHRLIQVPCRSNAEQVAISF